jgi:flagellar biogenesis protein FliO
MALQMVIALAFVIFLIIAFSFLYRKKQKAAGFISPIAYHSFGQKMGIAALRIGDEILVLGVTPTDMKLLRKIPDSAVVTQAAPGITERVRKPERTGKKIS